MDDAHEIVAAYWAAAEARDWARFGGLVAEDVVYEAPQTRERVRGREAYVRFNAEGFPRGLASGRRADRRGRPPRGELDTVLRARRPVSGAVLLRS
ncbi:MAG TPA: nuclear transport factor 2 family protein [Streptosporangiaceae bacterium]|nr:nuclear transport factor 2 family protein [Streptosporangiaceae bacterium]